MNNTIKTDDLIFKALNLLTIDRVICQTDKGTLTLKIRKGDNKYHLCLDSVPLDANQNKELMDILFPVKEKEIPKVNKTWNGESIKNDSKEAKILDALSPNVTHNMNGIDQPRLNPIPKNKGGRPKGSKNQYGKKA